MTNYRLRHSLHSNTTIDTLLKICEDLGTSSSDCPLDWCAVGVTQGSSLIEVALDFTEGFEFQTFFSQAKIDELKQTIEYVIGGKFDLDWIDFDKDTGKISITVPPNSIISQAEFDDIIEKLTNMLTGTSGGSMTNGFAVQSVAVTSSMATIDNSQAAWEGKNAETEGLSMVQVVGIGGACVALVAAVVGGVMWGKSRGGSGGSGSGTKQYGGKSVQLKAKGGTKKGGKKGSKFIKGGMDMDSYV